VKEFPKHIINALFIIIFISIFIWLFIYFSDSSTPYQEPPSSNRAQSLEDLQISTLNSNSVSFKDLKGKVVLINIWATWCGPCRIEIPELVSLKNELGSNIEIIGLSVDSSSKPVSSFISSLNINYPISMMSSSLDSYFGNVSVVPTTFIFDKQLTFQYKLKGYHNKQTLKDLIDPLIND
jgi:thiol-disulfide isomerase/thioredoxin